MATEPMPSATVAVVRELGARLQVLLLQRNTRENVWVFPGGKVEQGDGLEAAERPWDDAARRAAVRETYEEASLELDPEGLVPISRWITPDMTPKRFDTVFFLAHVAREAEVRVDGGEISGHRWFTPAEALEAYRGREIRLAPPTFVTVTWLADCADAEAARAQLGRPPILTFRPRVVPIQGGACLLYPGDAGYEEGDPGRPGARHRVWSEEGGFRYERS